jgi:AcrR family transcriptional regulator
VQRRARHTVEAILDAVTRILKRDGVDVITTNRIAEVAGVSIGSLYQYFPDKRAIFAALHRRHIEQVDHALQDALVRHAASPLDELIRALVTAMIEVHAVDPELSELLSNEIPHRADGTRDFAGRLHGAFRLALAARARELGRGRDLDTVTFTVTHMVESLCHGAVFRRPPGLSLRSAQREVVRAILVYLRA